MKCNLTRTDRDTSALHASLHCKLRFSRMKMLICNRNMLIQLLSFRCKRNSSIRSDKQFTPKLILQIIHKMSNIRLVAHQYFRRFRKALIHCYIIKNPVIIISNFHKFPPKLTLICYSPPAEVGVKPHLINHIKNVYLS